MEIKEITSFIFTGVCCIMVCVSRRAAASPLRDATSVGDVCWGDQPLCSMTIPIARWRITRLLQTVDNNRIDVLHTINDADMNFDNTTDVRGMLVEHVSWLQTLSDAYTNYSSDSSTPRSNYDDEVSNDDMRRKADNFIRHLDYLKQSVDRLLDDLRCDNEPIPRQTMSTLINKRPLSSIYEWGYLLANDLERFLYQWIRKSSVLRCGSSQ